MPPKIKGLLVIASIVAEVFGAIASAFHHSAKESSNRGKRLANTAVSRMAVTRSGAATLVHRTSPSRIAATSPNVASTGATCSAAAIPANDGYSGDYDVFVRSNVPNQRVTASDATDSYSYVTNITGSAEVYLWYTSPGEVVTVTVGSAHCTTSAQG